MPVHRTASARPAAFKPRALRAAAVAGALVLSTLPGQAMPRPTDEQMQSWLHREVDGAIPVQVVPLEPSPDSVRMGHAMLDMLWTLPPYRHHLNDWLDANSAAAASADDLLFAWERHYHAAFDESFAFQADAVSKFLWMVEGAGIARTVPRALCQSKSPEEIARLREDSRRGMLHEGAEPLGKQTARAIAREFEREDTTHEPRRKDGGTMAKVAIISLQATIKTLSPEDGKRLYDAYSHQPPKVDPREQCERAWVAADAVQMTELEDLPKGVSSKLLRQSIVQAAYSVHLRDLDAMDVVHFSIKGFDPGKSIFHKPMIMVRNRAAGTTRLQVHVDEAGRYAGSTLVSSSLQPEPFTGVDGEKVAPTVPLLSALDDYFRAGSFDRRVIDGNGKAYDLDLALDWR